MISLLYLLIVTFLTNILSVQCQNNIYCPRRNATVEKKFQDNLINKDFSLNETQRNEQLSFIKIRYLRKRQVNCGTNLSIIDTLIQPEVKFDVTSGPNDNSLFTFIMIGPIKPIPTPSLSLLHWLVTNIPGNDLKNGTTFAPYLNPFPIVLQGSYRYVFMVYRQSRYLEPDLQEIVRLAFAVTPWAIENGLSGPIAGNFFYEAVPGYYSPRG
ncbi:26 kDa secreted antigen-like [Panonychus citri]|uniref:26 kDa secreted antigen-like n=1 Tax=Panonychus citri TaxID=50023 RepID=UPI0023076855|nr:26 kDa secreted antigen-like [Panonychus citri]